MSSDYSFIAMTMEQADVLPHFACASQVYLYHEKHAIEERSGSRIAWLETSSRRRFLSHVVELLCTRAGLRELAFLYGESSAQHDLVDDRWNFSMRDEGAGMPTLEEALAEADENFFFFRGGYLRGAELDVAARAIDMLFAWSLEHMDELLGPDLFGDLADREEIELAVREPVLSKELEWETYHGEDGDSLAYVYSFLHTMRMIMRWTQQDNATLWCMVQVDNFPKDKRAS